jgi:hypothetical protein
LALLITPYAVASFKMGSLKLELFRTGANGKMVGPSTDTLYLDLVETRSTSSWTDDDMPAPLVTSGQEIASAPQEFSF